MTEATTQVESTEAAAPAVVLTPREKLVAKYNKLVEQRHGIDAALAAIVAEVQSLDDIASLSEGVAVYINVGKGETARREAGIILAVKDTEEGDRLFKVQYGVGFEADIATVKAGKLSRIPATQAE